MLHAGTPQKKQLTKPQLLKGGAIFLMIMVLSIVVFYYMAKAYVINHAEKDIQNLLLEHKGMHKYVQEVMHPALYQYQADGKFPKTFYAPELFSSSFIVRTQHKLYNEERQRLGLPPLYYKMAATNPRNPINLADPMESRIIAMFNKDRTLLTHREILNIDGTHYLYVAIPFLANTHACLKCHGNRNDSPAQLQSLYPGQGGFNEKLGEIRAITSIRAPIQKEYATIFIIVASVITGVMSITCLFLFNSRLRHLVSAQTQSLVEEKELLAVTLRSIGDGVITTDISGRVILINKVADTLTGWNAQDAVGRQLSDVFHMINEITRQPWKNPIEKILETGTTVEQTHHVVLVTKSGRERRIAFSGSPIRDDRSLTIGMVLAFRDITDQIRTEQELIKVKKLESIGVLAGGIAHDFNNILSVILGNIDLALSDSQIDDEAKELLDEAMKASLRAQGLTQQLLTFAKGGEPVKETASLADVITESANFILHGDKVACHYTFPDDLWLVDIDKGQISQVVQNIILNASQAMPGGGMIDVSCENVKAADIRDFDASENSRFVKMIIMDRGIGIPANILERIFDPYFSTKQKGSGLGLAITHSIISKHSGFISVNSTPGTGTTFTIYLPASGNDSVMAKNTASPEPAGIKARIMVMDDEEQIRKMTDRMLSKMGHEVILTADGSEAVKRYKESFDKGVPIDLVIMDLTIPGGMGGKDAVKEILAIHPQAKVLVSSGYSTDPVMASYSDFGFCDALVKPFQLSELKKTLKKILSN